MDKYIERDEYTKTRRERNERMREEEGQTRVP